MYWRNSHACTPLCIILYRLTNASSICNNRLQQVVHSAKKLIHSELIKIKDLYTIRANRRAGEITGDTKHSSSHLFVKLPPERCYRSTTSQTTHSVVFLSRHYTVTQLSRSITTLTEPPHTETFVLLLLSHALSLRNHKCCYNGYCRCLSNVEVVSTVLSNSAARFARCTVWYVLVYCLMLHTNTIP